jgi:hypothetical protein
MSLQRFLTAQTFVLLVCIPVWSQAFGTSVSGSTAAFYGPLCRVVRTYDKTGVRNSTGEASSDCDRAVGSANSTADLDKGSQGGVSVHTNPFDQGPTATASSQAMTFDTVTLIPPSTFHGDQVTFKMVDTYSTSTPSTLSVTVCWTIPNLVNDCITVHSVGQGTISKPITLQKSTSGFQFRVAKAISGNARAGRFNASYATTGDPDFTLPTGWTCRFASGRLCR